MSATAEPALNVVTREANHVSSPKGGAIQEWKMMGGANAAPPSASAGTEKSESAKEAEQQQTTSQEKADTRQGSPSLSQSSATKKGPNDFIFGKVIGEGSFSTVYLAKDVQSGREYAIKVCDKRHILREKKTEYVKREKEALTILSANSSPKAPFFVKLFCTFQDVDRLYYVLTYAKRGELLPYITRVGSFDEECSQFYAAEILCALEHMHSIGIIHRDLKPENILLSEKMHILITDFGSAKILHKETAADGHPTASSGPVRKNSFVGTAQYVSPELLTDKTASASSDLWALGCIIYQMVAGLPPFCALNEYHIFQKILKLEYEFPEGFLPQAKDLVQKLLVLNPFQRLGALDKGGYPSIKAHPFFSGMDFDSLYLQTPPQIYPYLPGTRESEALRSHYRVPDDLEPGLDDKQMTRLLGLELQDEEDVPTKPAPSTSPSSNQASPSPSSSPPSSASLQSGVNPSPRRRKLTLLSLAQEEQDAKLKLQASENKWHRFVEGNLILKQGLVDKHKGLFARRRMLLLTMGPHLYYVDPANMVLKGEIPWSAALRVEPKNFKIFFVHTPNRTYYLEDPDGYALEWCAAIDEVRKHTYGLES